MSEHFFAPCPRGLETALADELAGLGVTGASTTDGGVGFDAALDFAYTANLESRLASRILWQVGATAYRSEHDLYDFVRAIDWKQHFRNDRTLRVDTAATRSPIRSVEFATLRVKDAVCDRFRDETGVRPSVSKEKPDVRIHLHLSAERATLYLDTSGEPLFKRGYRREQADAPLRENLAAGLLALSEWRADTPLLDPMAGSGAIVIEAALKALDMAPGLKRIFGFQKLSWYDGPTWQRIKQAAQRRVRPAATRLVHASDREAAVLDRLRANAAAAGVADALEVSVEDVLVRAAPAAAGTLVTNPPYGLRIGEDDALAAFYPQLGDALKQRFAGWNVNVLTADLRMPKLLGLKPSRRIPLYNGALECRLYRYEIVAGSLRRPPRER